MIYENYMQDEEWLSYSFYSGVFKIIEETLYSS